MTSDDVLRRPAVRFSLVLMALLLGATSAWGQWKPGGTPGLDAGRPSGPVTIQGQILPPSSGAPAILQISATIQPGWHIYSLTQPRGGPLPTKIALTPSPNSYRTSGEFQSSPPPEKKEEAAFGGTIVESHYDRVVWSVPIELAPGSNPGQLRIEGTVKFQPCNATGCLLPETVPFTAVPVAAAAAPSPVVAPAAPVQAPAAPQASPPPAASRAEPAAPSAPAASQPPRNAAASAAMTAPAPAFDPAAVSAERAAQNSQVSLLDALVMGFLGGLILNLMPCVLPVIGLKILSFLEQAGQSRSRAFALNAWYSAGLLSVYLVLAALASFVGMGWGQQFGYVGFNITLAAVVFAMGLSFLGVWEIPIPGFVGRGKVNALAEREGASGAFAKGALTTVLATPCSAPFLGSALTWALAQPPVVIFAVFFAVGLGMATPYLLLGAFPELLRFLPKPGAWMETFKQLMGFVLLGTVIFLLTFLPGAYVVPTVGLLFGIWLACWWIGRTPYTAELADKVRVWLSAVVIVGIVFIVTFGWLAGLMQARYQEKRPFSPAVIENLVAEGHTVLVDFTADWCLTCKTLEATVLNTAQVQQFVQSNGVVSLKADWTNADPEVTKMLKQLGSAQVPVIAIFPAGNVNHPIVLIGGYTQQTLLEALQKAGPSRTVTGGQEQQKPPGV